MNTFALTSQINDFCSEIGKNPYLVQGAGGNISYKLENLLWVKASGTSLSDANLKDIFVTVDMACLRQEIKKRNFEYSPKPTKDTGLRPSIETMLHALMPHKIVVHLHEISVLTDLVKKHPIKIHNNIEGIDSLLVNYCKPGADLAREIYINLKKAPKTNVLFLKNHGVVFGGETIEEVKEILESLIENFEVLPKHFPSHIQFFNKSILNHSEYKQCTNPKIHSLAMQSYFLERLKSDWALFPDHVVFLGEEAVIVKNIAELNKIFSQKLFPPYIFFKDHGVLKHKLVSATQEEQLVAYYEVISRLSDDEELDTLSLNQVRQLLNWEAEKYRKKIQND